MTNDTSVPPGLDLAAIDGVVSDMDGVLWRGKKMLPGATEFLGSLRRRGIPFALATNNSGKTAAAYAARLRGEGLGEVSDADIITSGTATAEFLLRNHPGGTLVHVLGSDALHDVLAGAGFAVVRHVDAGGPHAVTGPDAGHSLSAAADPPRQAAAVVVGIDSQLTYAGLESAMRQILGGAVFYGTNADVSLPSETGLAPGAGSILAALSAATGREPTVIGKPETNIYTSALRRLGTRPERTLMIGDRLDTDILGAKRCGMRTALVLTGVESRASVDASDLKADAVFADLPALARAWSLAEAAVG